MRLLCFLLPVLSFVACHPAKQLTAPTVKVVVEDSLPVLPQSEIDLPIKVAGRPLLLAADSLFPREFLSPGWPNYLQPSCDFRYKYRFVRSGFIITCVNNVLGVQLTGNYQVAGAKCLCSLNKPVSPWISGSCAFGKEPLRRVNINVSSRLSFLPNFKIATITAPGKIDAMDKCYVSLFSSDVTQQVLDSIRASVK